MFTRVDADSDRLQLLGFEFDLMRVFNDDMMNSMMSEDGNDVNDVNR